MIVAAFAVAMLLFFPFRFKFEFNPDEGIQLIKALLYANGHALQTEIFSDQPPLFTIFLAQLFKLLGPKVLVARLSVLAFSCLLLTSCALYLKIFHGQTHYLIALLLLITLPLFPQLSVSAMIGLPAICLATVSLLALGLWHRSGKTSWLLLSSLALALSMFTKAFTVILVPVFAAAILLSPSMSRLDGRSAIRRWVSVAVWLGILVGTLVGLLLAFIGPGNWYQLVGVHIEARRATYEFEGMYVGTILASTWPLLALALAGGWLSVFRRSWSGMCLMGWFLLGIIALLVNRPAWWHQHILATIPGAMLAAVAIAESIAYLRRPRMLHTPLGWRGALSLLALLLAAGYLAVRIPGHLEGFKPKLPNLIDDVELTNRAYGVLAAMAKFDPEGGVIVTDSPMFAFRSRREIPPELAVFSDKRLSTGWLTEDQVIAAIRDRQPRLVLLARFNLPKVRAYVQDRYRLVVSYYPFRLFLRE